MAQLPTLEPFDCEGDPASVGQRWEKWKRAFELFSTASNVDNAEKKRATLLHSGGLTLQEVYFNLPGAHVECSDENSSIDVFKVAIQKLDEYFSPKQSNVYERHLFRLLKQEQGEKFEKFLIRLRHQSKKCNFAKEEDNLIDQITEKCSSTELRKKILTIGDAATLDKIITEANAIEAVDRQLNNFNPRDNSDQFVNKIGTNNNKGSQCTRCGSNRHNSDSSTCPARSKQCNKCKYIGHFQSQCRTRADKRKLDFDRNKNVKKPKYYKKPENGTQKEKIDYIFHIDDDDVVNCELGGVMIDMIIDSGSKCNIISSKTWTQLKDCNVKKKKQVKNPNKTFMAYGSQTPLTVLGSFEACIKVGVNSKQAVFYVIKDGERDLLGKETAVLLGILKIGLGINSVNDKKDEFPKFKDVTLEIAIDDSVKPISQPYRRVPIPLEEKINNKINELVALGIVEPVNEPSAWVSPLVPVIKGDGDIRVCVDMRCANKAIIRENHPLPTIDQLISNFRKSTIFSKLDILSAFHQIEISESSRHITTFIASKGLYRYKRLMFGISCAPEHFQKILERILLPCDGVVNFIDDIVVFGANESDHNGRLKQVLEVLKHNNVRLNDKKCIFGIKNVTFLGHQLSADGVKPLDKYVKVIDSFRRPDTIEEIQSLLGLVNFVGKWIPNLATITDPIRKLLRLKLGKNSNIAPYWKSEQDRAFQKIKACLNNISTLGFYDPRDKTQVMADASPVGLGAVLIQHDSRGPRIIAYGNKSLTDTEKRYCQTEKEALALVWAVEHFYMYLYGKETFDLITDHKPLEVIFGPHSKPCPRIERWVLRLQSYKYRIVYCTGKSNIADPLSRLCQKSTSVPFEEDVNYIQKVVEYSRPVALPLSDIELASSEDDDFKLVKEGLLSGNWDAKVNGYKVFENELSMHENLLLRGSKIVIPTKLRHRVLEAAHEGHPGIVAMKSRLRTKVWWPKIDRDAELLVKACRGCTLVSAPNPPNPMKRRELPVQAWIDVAVDFLGPLPSGHYLFVIIDYYSRYKEIKVMTSITATETIKILKEIFSRLGNPVTLTADNGKQFACAEFKTFCSEYGIRMYNTIPYWPQQNGEVERQNRDILKRLKISQLEKTDWKDDLLKYLSMYNSTPHSTTGKTPSELFFKRQFRDKIPSLIDFENSQIDSDVRDKDREMKTIGKEVQDRKRKAKENELELGQKVYVKNLVKDNKLTPNFNPVPHTVVGTKGSEINVRNDETGQEFRRNIIHLKKVEGEWKVCDKGEENSDVNGEIEEGEDKMD